MRRKAWVGTLVLALVGVCVGAHMACAAELVFRVERVTGDLWAKGWIETSTGFKFPDGTTMTTAALGNGNGWSLTGNSGTNPDTHFLGTTDNVPFEIRVNNVRALRIVPRADSPMIIGGWHGNTVVFPTNSGATIGGGGREDYPNVVAAAYGTVSGGVGNSVGMVAVGGTVAGGAENTASRMYSTVSGGLLNTAGGDHATVGGGERNTASGSRSTVGGGERNTASDGYATVGGGERNTASGSRSTVGGGVWNTASGQEATVGGGNSNVASGRAATVAGGGWNTAAGDWSFVVGRSAKNTNEWHNGVFMFADSTVHSADFSSTAANQFSVRASGGYRLFSNAALTSGMTMAAGANSWSGVSDRNVKANFTGVDTVKLLDALKGMPVTTWNLQAQPEEIRHIGPVAQDFNTSFGYLFGEVESPLHINTMDAVGVSLAASQGLYTLVQEQAGEIAQLTEENAQQAAEIEDLRARLEALEKLVQGGE